MSGSSRIHALLISMGFAFVVGCQGPEGVSQGGEAAPALQRERAFEADMLALKARESDPARREAAARELVVKHGFALPDGLGNGRAAPDPGPVGVPGFSEAVRKEAADSPAPVIRYYTVKDYTDIVSNTYSETIAVPGNGVLTASTKRIGTTDPILLLYFAGSDAPIPLVVAAGNDDNGSSLDASITWKNPNTWGVSMRLISFAESQATSGGADIVVKINNDPAVTKKGAPVAGRVYAVNNVKPPIPSHCGPVRVPTRITGFKLGDDKASVTVLALNTLIWKGLQMGVKTSTTGKTDPLDQGRSFLLGFRPVLKADKSVPESLRMVEEAGYSCQQ